MQPQTHRAKGAMRRYADGGLIEKLFGKSAPEETASQKWDREAAVRMARAAKNAPPPATAQPATPPATPIDQKAALKLREQAAGLAKGGKIPTRAKGAMRHPQAKGKDTVPIMAQPGEFMVKKAAVEHVGVDFMKKLNAVADGGKVPAKKKARGAVRGFAAGGMVLPEDTGVAPSAPAPVLPAGQFNPTTQPYQYQLAKAEAARTAATPAPAARPAMRSAAAPSIAPGAAPARTSALQTDSGFNLSNPTSSFITGAGIKPLGTVTQGFGGTPDSTSPSTRDSIYGEAERYAKGGVVKIPQRARGAVRHMATGGLVEDELKRRVAPYVNHRAPSGPPAVPPPLQITNGMAAPGTALAQTPYKPNFTMGATPAAAPVVDQATDERPKYNPVNGSPEAKAYQASRAPAPATAPAPAAEPVARVAGPRPLGAVRGAVNRAAGVVGGAAVPIALGATAAQGLTTDTEQYAKRFGLENTQPGVMRDLGIRTLGAASDLGNTMALGIPKALGMFRDDGSEQPATGQLPANVTVTPTRAPVVPAPAATAPAPEAVNNQVTRVGNSYSGAPGISGDIMVNGARPRGGAIRPQDNMAAENLARRYGQTSGFGTATAGQGTVSSIDTSQGYAQDLRDIERMQAARQPDPVAQLIDNGRPMTAKKLGAISKARSDAAETTNLNADRTVARAGVTLDNQAKQQLLTATMKMTSAKTAAERLKASDELQALHGKWQKELPNRFTVVPGGQYYDAQAQAVLHSPARVIDNQTQQFIDQPQAGGVTTKAQYDAMKKGDRYTGTDGKQYIKD